MFGKGGIVVEAVVSAHKVVNEVSEQSREVPDGLLCVCEAANGIGATRGLG